MFSGIELFEGGRLEVEKIARALGRCAGHGVEGGKSLDGDGWDWGGGGWRRVEEGRMSGAETDESARG